MSYSEIWQKLSGIDCSKHIEKKGNLSYLSWAWAWGVLMDAYPQATYKVHKERWGNDGTCEARVTVTIDDCTRMMWLPVMDNRNNAVANPTMRQISDTRMRCLVKCIAMFGLGHYIYAGEDLPQGPAYTDSQRAELIRLLADEDSIGLRTFVNEVGTEVMDALFNSAEKGQKSRFKQQVRDLYAQGTTQIKAAVAAIQEALDAEDASAIDEIFAEMDGREVAYVDAALSDIEKHKLSQLREAA